MSKNVDFLPDDYLDKKAQRQTNLVCLVLFFVVVGSVGAGFLLIQQRHQGLKKKLDRVNRQMAQASSSLDQLEELETKKEKMITKANVCGSLLEKCPRSLILATLTNDLPRGVSLLEYEMESKEIKPEREAPSRSRSKSKRSLTKKTNTEKEADAKPPVFTTTIDIAGLAPTDLEVAQLISNLDQSQMFNAVNLQLSEEYEMKDEIVRKFKIIVLVDPEFRASMADVEIARNKHISGM